MTLHNIIAVLVSLAWLAAQSVAVAGHCQGLGGSLDRALSANAHDHDHAEHGMHAHHGKPSAAGSYHHHDADGPVPAGVEGVPHVPDTTQSSEDCSVGYVALALQNAVSGDVLLPTKLTGGSAGRPLQPLKTNLPTPPPNAVL